MKLLSAIIISAHLMAPLAVSAGDVEITLKVNLAEHAVLNDYLRAIDVRTVDSDDTFLIPAFELATISQLALNEGVSLMPLRYTDNDYILVEILPLPTLPQTTVPTQFKVKRQSGGGGTGDGPPSGFTSTEFKVKRQSGGNGDGDGDESLNGFTSTEFKVKRQSDTNGSGDESLNGFTSTEFKVKHQSGGGNGTGD